MSDEGNVVLAYTSSDHLQLDYDLKTEAKAVGFTREYAKFHDLGSALTILTSEVKQMDLSLDKDNLLNRYSGIFGKTIDWQETRWHVKEAYRLGMVEKDFLALRQFGSITIRTSARAHLVFTLIHSLSDSLHHIRWAMHDSNVCSIV